MQDQMAPAATPQWADALEKANEVRFKRADIKRDLKAGRTTLEHLLTDPPEVILDVPVHELLTWLPGIKRKRALRILGGIVYSEAMTVGRLGEATRRKVVEKVAHHQPTRDRYVGGHYGAAAA